MYFARLWERVLDRLLLVGEIGYAWVFRSLFFTGVALLVLIFMMVIVLGKLRGLFPSAKKTSFARHRGRRL